jgi:hypothetical protein
MTDTIDDVIVLPPLQEDPMEKTRRTPMADAGEERIRALIRLIPPVRALKEDLEQSLHLETYAGTGDLAVRSFQGLQASVARITDDPYVGTLVLSVPENADDKSKVSLARLAAGQLASSLEGQTGLVSLGGSEGGSRNINIQKAPMLNFVNVEGLPSEAFGKMVDRASDTLNAAEETEEP